MNQAMIIPSSSYMSDIEKMRAAAEFINAKHELIMQVMKNRMREDVHYGKIPGTPKPCLYKAGAEMLRTLFDFQISSTSQRIVENGEITFISSTTVYDRHGNPLATKSATASSLEKAHKWRAAICPEEFDETPPDRRKEEWRKGKDGPYKAKLVRIEPADIENTLIKKGEKRSMVASILVATGVSEYVTQDVEDMPREIIDQGHSMPSTATTESQEAIPDYLKCELCGKAMVKRKKKGTNSEFWGCSGYPACRHTKQKIEAPLPIAEKPKGKEPEDIVFESEFAWPDRQKCKNDEEYLSRARNAVILKAKYCGISFDLLNKDVYQEFAISFGELGLVQLEKFYNTLRAQGE